jgi:hypothetical protein
VQLPEGEKSISVPLFCFFQLSRHGENLNAKAINRCGTLILQKARGGKLFLEFSSPLIFHVTCMLQTVFPFLLGLAELLAARGRMVWQSVAVCDPKTTVVYASVNRQTRSTRPQC